MITAERGAQFDRAIAHAVSAPVQNASDPQSVDELAAKVGSLTGIIAEAAHYLFSGHGINIIEAHAELLKILEGEEAELYRRALRFDEELARTLRSLARS